MLQFNKPWPHTVTDSLYSSAVFTVLREQLIKYARIHSHMLLGGPVKQNYYAKYDEPARLDLAFRVLVSQFPDLTPWLNSEYSYDPDRLAKMTQVSIMYGNDEYDLHCDAPWKAVSAVTFVDPDESVGTLMFDENKEFSHEIEWQPNRSLIFTRSDDKTWHSYRGVDNQWRITIINALVDLDLMEDHDIHKSYR